MFRAALLNSLVFFSAVTSMGMFSPEGSTDDIIARAGREYQAKYGLGISAVIEGASPSGLWTVLGVILQGPGCYTLDETRAILLDCRSILLEQINSCPGAESRFESYPFDHVRVIICFDDYGRSCPLAPHVASARFNEGVLTYSYDNEAGQKAHSRQVRESLQEALAAVSKDTPPG
jgi:hypothetical protein